MKRKKKEINILSRTGTKNMFRQKLKSRIIVEPSGGMFAWKIQEYDAYNDFWNVALNWENTPSEYFQGYATSKDRAINEARDASKEYCRQRELYRSYGEYFKKDTYVEAIKCLD